MRPPFTNQFFGGRNTDTDPSRLEPNQYVSAYNVELVGDGKYTSLQNINGTTEVATITTSTNTLVLGVFKNKYLINGSLFDGLTIFTAEVVYPNIYFKIYAFTVTGSNVYELYEEQVDSTYFGTVSVVDAVNFPENGVDTLYFTDFYKPLRYLKCEIPSPYSANFLTEFDITLQRKGANGTIDLTSVDDGGSLLSGTRQYSYRMADPTNKRFTKWSSPTNPIHVYDKANASEPVYSGIGLPTTRKITLSITPSEEETDNFDYLQLAVIENVGPTTPIVASLLDIEAISGTSLTYEHKSDTRIGTIPLEDIVVDLAQIETVKTLNVKDNRLFAGNIKYTELEFDNGEPEIASGTILRQGDTSVDSFSSDEFASNYVGHWRGEVYRYGAIYRDENGNAAPVKPLDLSGVTDNAITSGLTDMKFPDRTSANYTLFNGSGQIQSLGLRLTGLTNHPSWARSVEIVRLPRKKNILFQSPIIPMSTIHGIGALDDYPNNITYSTTLANERTVEDATPMTSGSTIVPKNMFWPEQRGINKVSATFGSGTNRHIAGEAQLATVPISQGYQYSMIFPSPSMYDATPFVYTGAEKLDFVDYALLKASIDATANPTKSPVTVVTGDDMNTNVSGTFYALQDSQYYFNNGHAKSAIAYTDRAVTDYEMFDNLGQPDSVSGKVCMDYESLQTGGVALGFKPNIQKSAVIKVGGSPIRDIMGTATVFAAATLIERANGGLITAGGLTYESNLTNNYINTYSGYTNDSSYVNAVSIVNVKLGLGDDRYGELTDLHEYISTGTKYTFSTSEIATLEGGGNVVLGDLDVWGGDCFVGPHTFKIADTAYSVTNQPKNNDNYQTTEQLLSKWNDTLYKDTAGACFLCIPVAVENAAQYVQVVIESEYNGQVREPDILTGSSATIPVMIGTATTARSPLTYKYNINLSKQNYQKIYVPKPQYSFEQNDFQARIIYSDIKIYNSDQAGFDIFRVGNIHDLEEKYRGITKLALAGNSLYAIQERGVTYLPTGETQVEQADGGTLAVISGQVIGKPIIIDGERGSQHIKGIVEAGGIIYIPDANNKSIYSLSGQTLQSITKDNESEFRDFFADTISESNLYAGYDPIRREYWIGRRDSTNTQIYNERGLWVGIYEFSAPREAIYTAGNMYVFNNSVGGVKVHTMYSGDVNQLFGTTVTPRVTVVCNPDMDFTKTFDDSMAVASERLFGADFEVFRESQLGNQTCSASLDIESYQGNYRVKNPRATNSARLRGMYMQVTLKWKAVQSALRSFNTKYRLTSRVPW